MRVKLLTEHHLASLSLKADCTGLSESTLVRMLHCWKSHVTAHIICYGTTTMFSSRYEKMFRITFLLRASLCFQKTGISQGGQLVYEDLSIRFIYELFASTGWLVV